MQKDIGDDVRIGQSVASFQSVGKSVAIDKTASDFDNANLKVRKNYKAYQTRDLRRRCCPLHPRDLRTGFSRIDKQYKNH